VKLLKTEKFKAIDIHTHLGPWRKSEIVKYQYKGPFDDYFSKAHQVGIDKTVIFKIKEGENKEVVEYVEKKKDSLLFAYWIDVKNKKILNELEFYRKKIVALKFHPTFEWTKVTDKKLKPYWDWAQEENLPLLLHCGQTQKIAGFRIAAKFMKKYSFPIVLFHMAGGGNISTQVEAIKYFKKNPPPNNAFIETSSCFAPWIIEEAIRVFGEDKVVFGSDFPSHDPRVALNVILQTDVPTKVRNKVLFANSKKILKI